MTVPPTQSHSLEEDTTVALEGSLEAPLPLWVSAFSLGKVRRTDSPGDPSVR